MKLKIIKSFTSPDSPRPFMPDELIEVSDELAKQWIDEGKAIKFPIMLTQPARRKREKAVIG
jgi:hypothetical protein